MITVAEVNAVGGARAAVRQGAWAAYRTPFESIFPKLRDQDQVLYVVMCEWCRTGAQTVQLPATYAAALMATDSHAALHEQELPWPTFEIEVPPGLLRSSHGEVVCVHVSQTPEQVLYGKYPERRLSVVYTDEISSGVRRYRDLPAMFDRDLMDQIVTDGLEVAYDANIEERLWTMIARLVGGVVLAIAAARAERPGSFRAGVLRTKRDKIRPNTFTVGKPLKLDCRQDIRDFIEGRRSSSPKVTTLVRGHWRHQVHGPANSKRRLQWIQPFFRGEGPLLVRPTQIGATP